MSSPGCFNGPHAPRTQPLAALAAARGVTLLEAHPDSGLYRPPGLRREILDKRRMIALLIVGEIFALHEHFELAKADWQSGGKVYSEVLVVVRLQLELRHVVLFVDVHVVDPGRYPVPVESRAEADPPWRQ